MYQLEAKVVKILEPVTGVSQRTGEPWTSQTFVTSFVENERERFVAFSVFNKTLNIKEGDNVIVDFTPSARENQTTGKWFTSLYVNSLSIIENKTVNGMVRERAPQQPQYAQQKPQFAPQEAQPQQAHTETGSDLPF